MDGNFYIYTDLSALPVDEHEAYWQKDLVEFAQVERL